MIIFSISMWIIPGIKDAATSYQESSIRFSVCFGRSRLDLLLSQLAIFHRKPSDGYAKAEFRIGVPPQRPTCRESSYHQRCTDMSEDIAGERMNKERELRI